MWKLFWILLVFLLITDGYISGSKILNIESPKNPDQAQKSVFSLSNNDIALFNNKIQEINQSKLEEDRFTTTLILQLLKGLNNILHFIKNTVYFIFGYYPEESKNILLQLQNVHYGFIDRIQEYFLKTIDYVFHLLRYFNDSLNSIISGLIKIGFDGTSVLTVGGEKLADIVNSFINTGMFIGKRIAHFFLVFFYYGFLNISEAISIGWVFFFEFIQNIPILGRIVGLKEYVLDKFIDEVKLQIDHFLQEMGNIFLRRKSFILPRLSYLVSLTESLGDVFSKLTDDPRFHLTNNDLLKDLTYIWNEDIVNILKYLENYFESDGKDSFLENIKKLWNKTWQDIEDDVPS